ncbi:MnhB domain-containing protein [Glycocaulis sp.]|uniref:MnhB domain-containing protein n=1 Tax=Glycocaulis sp. TaxID=1969725 RepID=UPI0025C3879A|nr:MnhB domain-containing protein [Glycocaulis sp.]MCH8521280.1 Na(+)/H(+) antiporter subunit B [Glycocaulis sp.]
MQSVILNALARLFFVAMAIFSLFILLRGHDEPGGGFIGGLAAASAYTVVTLAFGTDTARKWLILHPVVLMGVGLFCAILSGLPPLIGDFGGFLYHLWWEGQIGFLELKLGTTLIFDIGVYFVVVGGVLSILFRMYETGAEEAGQ